MTVSGLTLRKKLYEHFGFRRFRPGQAQAVRAALEGRDTLVLMPTGSGKSLCFQLPAMEMSGTTLVVSPLIALMKDQVSQLRARGVVAHEVNSTLTADERRLTEYAIAIGEPQFVYTTPEQLAIPEFRALLKRQPLDLFVVDEAHCISQWGHDFRPDFLALGQALDDFGRPPVLALTATSTPDIIDDILTALRIPDAEIIHTGFYRPNLQLSVTTVAGDGEKRERLLELLGTNPGAGIVYCATVKAVEEVTSFLQAEDVEVEAYHGRLAAKRRAQAQERFMQDHSRVMIATNAFGLGIDKADIRFIVHYHLPGNIESFYQEFGRAGRDGDSSTCVLLYDREDAKLQRFLGGGRFPSESDVVNAYHALGRAASGSRHPTLAEIAAIAPLNRSRLKTCLDLMANRRIVAEDAHRRYHLIRSDLSRDELARAGQSYREREEQAKLRQQRMIDYAENPVCRWGHILKYFESDEATEGPCGHCDCCGIIPRLQRDAAVDQDVELLQTPN
jgi:ATP-dependent DNA helicase RecQ